MVRSFSMHQLGAGASAASIPKFYAMITNATATQSPAVFGMRSVIHPRLLE